MTPEIKLIIDLLEEVMYGHSCPEEHTYNECDKDRCAWCEDAAIAIKYLNYLDVNNKEKSN